ncbi:hypothetical protein [Anaerosoma tenue]|uniref:hypothetical protein n=1 Tax=Anaerosoma tenue TaxID=2933588 RepID=UPI002260D919|nr:hypothetical protein [Anaerosoma tenue]MCK8114838.1 hypothetical protein [Anaerosoma tenue]
MRTRTIVAVVLALLLMLALPGCACSPDEPGTPTDTGAEAPAPEPDTEPDNEPELPPLENEEQYLALLGIGLELYGLTPADGEVVVLESMEGYGALQWSSGDHVITITLRDVENDWRWDYVDDTVSVEGATPDPMTDAERASFLELAARMVEAVGGDGATVVEQYTWKATDGIKQGNYLFGSLDDERVLHIATDGEGHLGYSYMTHEL